MEVEEEVVPAEPVVPPGPEPGTEDWVYIEQPLDKVIIVHFYTYIQ